MLPDGFGVIYETYYYASTNISLGQVAGYVSDIGLRQGQSGTTVYTHSFTYSSQASFNGGSCRFFVSCSHFNSFCADWSRPALADFLNASIALFASATASL